MKFRITYPNGQTEVLKGDGYDYGAEGISIEDEFGKVIYIIRNFCKMKIIREKGDDD